MRRPHLVIALCTLLALTLVACGPAAQPEPATATTAATAAPTMGPTAVPPTAAPAEPPASPAPLSAPVGPDDCLVGEWEMSDIASYVVSVLPAEVIVEDDSLEFVGTSGSLSYLFSYDSSVTMIADAYTFEWTLSMSGVPPMPMQVVLNGASAGHFSTVGGSLTIDEGAPDDLSLTVIVAGQTVTSEADKVGTWLPLGSAEEMTYSYTCDGGVMKIVPDVPNALPIRLQRVQG